MNNCYVQGTVLVRNGLVCLALLSLLTILRLSQWNEAMDEVLEDRSKRAGGKILCWILTYPMNKNTQAAAVKETWGRRCDKLLFMTSEKDPEDDSFVALEVTEDRKNLWTKTQLSLEYIYNNHFAGYDWFFKADDDTYVIVENLRKFASQYSPQDPAYFGCRFKPFVTQGYMSGGAGYLLSRESLKRFIVNGFRNETRNECNQLSSPSEDVQLGRCLEKVGVVAMNTTDAMGGHRFFPLDPTFLLYKENKKKRIYWLFRYIYEPLSFGDHAYSKEAISFHYIPAHAMKIFDLFLYRIRVAES
ncbi:glycoprotein-N-acetylgalactosamine 3-beta-galactosyltransferase 1-like isoform X3 [Tigriopus californicus]|uniref:glycoprotein-N-acetylgalactosamine 3-beta-galactosyltransferase 1-like isoform X3 n=1 Tax=Tigriopus californicus TaxID=6832 RepID=UPI0027DA3759|nr:glycoprotein-N-acetylgalactosamine 3-beta-galactosyltransferase 1-like isoform X3 [Tigriopus californicus]XP_059089660.1 glycoprotein-N-acetylgalactosamine 3-beta-galactosyltransferase 1-like isoform X3 [Tigriopus californicus]